MLNIFENIEFIGLNESKIGDKIIERLIDLFNLVLTPIYKLADSQIDKSESEVNKLLAKYASKYREVNEFNKKAAKVEHVTCGALLKELDKDEDLRIYTRYLHSADAYVIRDTNGNIMAYAIFNIGIENQYGYKIIDRSFKQTSELKTFVKATFENAAHVYGSGLKVILKTNQYGYKNYEAGNDASVMSKQDLYRELSIMRSIYNKVLPVFKSAESDVLTFSEDVESDSHYEKASRMIKKYVPKMEIYLQGPDFDDEDEEDGYWDYLDKNPGFNIDDELDAVYKKAYDICTSYGFVFEDKYVVNKATSTKYPNIEVDLYLSGWNLSFSVYFKKAVTVK